MWPDWNDWILKCKDAKTFIQNVCQVSYYSCISYFEHIFSTQEELILKITFQIRIYLIHVFCGLNIYSSEIRQ
jgi:hypothetical protein